MERARQERSAMSTRGWVVPGSGRRGRPVFAPVSEPTVFAPARWTLACASALLAALVVAGCRSPGRTAQFAEPETLPVYRLAVPVVNEARAGDVARRIFGAA